MKPLTENIVIKLDEFSFSDRPLFLDFQFSLSPGETTVILGGSGVGKSTLLKIIAGLVDSDYTMDSDDIAYLAQEDLLMPWLNVLNNVLIGYKLRGGVCKSTIQKAKDILKLVGLNESIQSKPSALSGGMRQRVAVARTLIEDKSIILMDEPFSALDVKRRVELQNLTNELFQEKTVVMVTHDPMEALRCADRIIILSGQPVHIVYDAPIDSNRPRDISDPNLLSHEKILLGYLLC